MIFRIEMSSPNLVRGMERARLAWARHFLLFVRTAAGEHGTSSRSVVYADFGRKSIKVPPEPAYSEKRLAPRLSMARHGVTTSRTDIILLAFLGLPAIA